MGSSKVAFAAIGVACVLAAGAGGYFALRQNAAPEPAALNTPGSTTTAGPATTPAADNAKPVQETEAVVSPQEKPAAKAPIGRRPEPKPKPETALAQPTSAPAVKAVAATQPPPAPVPDPAPVPTRQDTPDRVAQDAPLPPPLPPPPPQPTLDELVVSTDSVIGLQSDTTVTSERARVEDRVEARVTRDVKVGDRVAIPAGSRAIGYVSQVERGGKFKEQAKLAIRFQTIVLADGTRLPISTAPVEREGESKSNSSAAKVGGGAIAGTILGAILGGGKGAAIGAAAGAGGGTAAVEAGDRSVATLRAGEPITIRLLSPVSVTTESK